MSDSTLLILGCVVTFIAIAGAYVAIRGVFDKHNELGPAGADTPVRGDQRPRKRPLSGIAHESVSAAGRDPS